MPDALKSKLLNAKEHHQNGEGCIWCRQIEQLFYYENKIYNPDGSILVEVNQRDRLVAESDKFVAIIPFAARMPYEIHILPKTHQHSFIETTPAERIELARMLKLVLSKVYKLLGNPPYNFYIHSAPNLNVRPRTGNELTTVEGLAKNGELNPVQKSFIQYGGFQCGICTPGQVVAATALLKENPKPNEDEIKDWMMGNLCRCTGYYKIIESIEKAHQFAK